MFFKALKEYENMTPGLSRIKNFFESIGNPQDNIKSVHIAGTNGKGSTAVFISEILKSGGYKTALYTSPHLIDITERIKINNKSIPTNVFDYLSKKYLDKAIKYKLSYFEYLTTLAFIYFVEQKADIAVIETGLGGRFDATNIIKSPLICVITSIAKDHQEVLGTTIEKIIFEKVGIIKKDACVVCGKLPRKAVIIVEKKSMPYLYGKDFKAVNIKSCIFGQEFDYIIEDIKLKDIKIKLLGKHQIINASVAICVVCLLNKKGYFLNKDHIRAGLKNTVWAGRFDLKKINVNNKNFKLVMDGAHNIHGLNAFLKTFKQLGFAKKRRVFIFTVMKEKEYKCMVKKIAPFVKKIILPQIYNYRAINVDVLKTEFLKYIPQNRVYTVTSVKNAFNIISADEIIVVVGSIYLIGEILAFSNK
jgi:dihydrofolate synthase/folylpolyglutamate synthase